MNAITIGRDRKCNIVVPENYRDVGDVHALIMREDDWLVLEDRSFTGVYVNDVLVNARYYIEYGDEIRLGDRYRLSWTLIERSMNGENVSASPLKPRLCYVALAISLIVGILLINHLSTPSVPELSSFEAQEETPITLAPSPVPVVDVYTKCVALGNGLIKYTPIGGCRIRIYEAKPAIEDTRIKLCIAVAYGGDVVVKGRYKPKQIPDDNGDGFYAEIAGRQGIFPANDSLSHYITRTKNSRGQLFTQQLLIYNAQIYSRQDDKTKAIRYALVEKKGDFYILQSAKKLTVTDFQELLVIEKVRNAIALPLSPEGYYRDGVNKLNSIGEETNSRTKKIWLTYE